MAQLHSVTEGQTGRFVFRLRRVLYSIFKLVVNYVFTLILEGKRREVKREFLNSSS